MENKEDMIIKCRNCGKEFTYTVGEQKFYEEKGFAAPVRCKECRAARKAEQEKKNTPKESLDDMLAKFQANTVCFEEESRKSRR